MAESSAVRDLLAVTTDTSQMFRNVKDAPAPFLELEEKLVKFESFLGTIEGLPFPKEANAEVLVKANQTLLDIADMLRRYTRRDLQTGKDLNMFRLGIQYWDSARELRFQLIDHVSAIGALFRIEEM